jgi:hypothetical protein
MYHNELRGYRLSLDDNIWVLRDLAKDPDRYPSVFDHPYLAMYRDIHREHGTKVHMNIYYECPGFDLTQMPDRWKDEWRANAHWLRLSFHARANDPEKPYEFSGYDEMYRDCTLVQREILRFAGPEVLVPVTTLHYCEATTDGIRALYDCGIRALLGDFALDEEGNPAICYSFDRERWAAVRRDVFFRDEQTGMIFFPCDIVLNCFTPEQIGPELTRMARLYPDRDFIDILIHEQYFYPDYVNYLPDYRQRVEAGICWCEENGYRPAFVTDMIDL